MAIQLHNTRTRKKELFTPLAPDRVTMYVCGPTVYGDPHIGNARPPVVFDLLYRLLRRHYKQVIYARNITDVDDKIMAAAKKEGRPIKAITSYYTAGYREQMAALGTLPPDLEPRATEHIPQMVDLIQRLVASGHAYVEQAHVLFDTTTDPDYGRLSGRSQREMLAGARVEVAPYKHHPGDFVLWKPSSEEQIGWDSPWGRGRPGWHTECSAMIGQHLGKTIDIHGGGSDLVFPHHENELAQSRCANHDHAFVRYWVHNGFVTIDRDKMSKSVGNVVTVHQLLKRYPGEVLRLALMSAHYRQPLDWSAGTVRQARERLDRMYLSLRALSSIKVEQQDIVPPQDLLDALEDDLNTPQALSVLAAYVTQANSAKTAAQKRHAKLALLGCGEQLGLFANDPEAWLKGDADPSASGDQAAIETLVAAREAARQARDFAEADRIRDELQKRGIVLEDSPEGTRWRVES